MKQETFVRTIRKTGSSVGVNIPPEIMQILGLKENDIVRVTVERIK